MNGTKLSEKAFSVNISTATYNKHKQRKITDKFSSEGECSEGLFRCVQIFL